MDAPPGPAADIVTLDCVNTTTGSSAMSNLNSAAEFTGCKMTMNQVHVLSQQGRPRLRELKRYLSMPPNTTLRGAYNKYKTQPFSQPTKSKYRHISFGSDPVSFGNNPETSQLHHLLSQSVYFKLYFVMLV